MNTTSAGGGETKTQKILNELNELTHKKAQAYNRARNVTGKTESNDSRFSKDVSVEESSTRHGSEVGGEGGGRLSVGSAAGTDEREILEEAGGVEGEKYGSEEEKIGEIEDALGSMMRASSKAMSDRWDEKKDRVKCFSAPLLCMCLFAFSVCFSVPEMGT